MKEELEENINEYKKFNLIYRLTKSGSRDTVDFVSEDQDSWFIYVLKYNTNSGKISRNNYIVNSDLQTWLDVFIHDGFTAKEI